METLFELMRQSAAAERIVNAILPELNKIDDDITLASVLGVCLDQWGVDHNVSIDRLNCVMMAMLTTRREANEICGALPKTANEEV